VEAKKELNYAVRLIRQDIWIKRVMLIMGVYLSSSAKVISQVREWYVDEVLYQVNKTYLGAAEMINEQIDNNFDDPDGVRDANKKGAGLLNRLSQNPQQMLNIYE
jgi:hypothetical protein